MTGPPAEKIARAFHEAYERLAPEYGYRTREESAVPWDRVPERNRRLMVATVREVFAADKDREDELTKMLLDFASVKYPPDVGYHPDVKDSARMAAQRFLAGGSGEAPAGLTRDEIEALLNVPANAQFCGDEELSLIVSAKAKLRVALRGQGDVVQKPPEPPERDRKFFTSGGGEG